MVGFPTNGYLQFRGDKRLAAWFSLSLSCCQQLLFGGLYWQYLRKGRLTNKRPAWVVRQLVEREGELSNLLWIILMTTYYERALPVLDLFIAEGEDPWMSSSYTQDDHNLW